MVFFICEACGETLKKNKVDAHSWGCKNCWVFACMDCGVRFEGEKYKEHLSCVSEAQKYQGKLFQSKENKGEAKQRSWIEGVQQRLDTAPGGSQLRPFAERLLAYENVPRKKAKFLNFAKNSLNLKATRICLAYPQPHDTLTVCPPVQADREGIAEKLWQLVEESNASDATAPAAPAPAAPAPAAPASAALAAVPSSSSALAPMGGASSQEAAEAAGHLQERAGAVVLTADAEKEAARREKKAAKRARAGADGGGGSGSTATQVQDERHAAERREARVSKKHKKAKAAEAEAEGGAVGGAGPKPVKWKKIITKELLSEGGSMKLKDLRTAAVKEARAHPSHASRDARQLASDFDDTFGSYTGVKGKFILDGKRVRLAAQTT